jgi:hypothetical protein
MSPKTGMNFQKLEKKNFFSIPINFENLGKILEIMLIFCENFQLFFTLTVRSENLKNRNIPFRFAKVRYFNKNC